MMISEAEEGEAKVSFTFIGIILCCILFLFFYWFVEGFQKKGYCDRAVFFDGIEARYIPYIIEDSYERLCR